MALSSSVARCRAIPSAYGLVHITLVSGEFDSAHREVFLKIEAANGRPLTGSYSLTISSDRVTDGGRYDAWIYAQSEGAFTAPQEVDTVLRILPTPRVRSRSQTT